MLEWTFKRFDELTSHEVYEILGLRAEIFVVEQACVYQDIDGRDPLVLHLMGREEGKLVAYARVLPPGVTFEEPSIGRVVVAKSHRKTGSGRALMRRAIEESLRLFPGRTIEISAQLYLKKFYESLGFVGEGEPYLEDDILHLHMVRGGEA